MDIFSSDISSLVFKRNISKEMGNLSLTPLMLNVLVRLDGTKKVSVIARDLNINPIDLNDVLRRLSQLNLISRVETSIPLLDESFFTYLESLLASIAGPMAGLLIKDAMKELGIAREKAPITRAAEMIDLISAKIFIADKRQMFREAMVARLRGL
ncbi:MAG: hypothetical protein GY859_04925 [Desulfobacterales bacterium]|nr:hypothetical protein [Desulfobacterales bacterium]